MSQNKSHAVMSQRVEADNSLDDFPTPPWATRALLEYVVPDKDRLSSMTCLEPACGRGHMAATLAERFGRVEASDVFEYGYGQVRDFSKSAIETGSFDWVITNPPFRLAEDFIVKSLNVARVGVAMLTRTVFVESVGRYDRLFSKIAPYRFAQFTERVPMVKGRVDKKASTATGYAWIVWLKAPQKSTELFWIPPCRKALERDGDYVQAPILGWKPAVGEAVEAVSATVVKLKPPSKSKKPKTAAQKQTGGKKRVGQRAVEMDLFEDT